MKFLPIGVPVPPGGVADGYPVPYAPGIYPEPMQTSSPSIVPNVPKALLDSVLVWRGSSPTSGARGLSRGIGAGSGIHAMTAGDQGWNLPGTPISLYAAIAIDTGVTLPTNATNDELVGAWLFAGSPSCMQVAAFALRPAGTSSATTPYLWSTGCSGGNGQWTMDATWQSKYARTLNGRLEFIAQTGTYSCANSPCFWVLIFNFTMAQWEILKASTGGYSTGFDSGTMYSTTNMLSCPTIPSGQVDGVLWYSPPDATWYAASFYSAPPRHLNQYCFANGYWDFYAPYGNGWVAATPNP
jgi:hypothetical protein